MRASNRETRLKAENPFLTIEEHAERYFRARGPREAVSLTALLLGDPVPSRSALAGPPPACHDDLAGGQGVYRVPGLPRIKFLERT